MFFNMLNLQPFFNGIYTAISSYLVLIFEENIMWRTVCYAFLSTSCLMLLNGCNDDTIITSSTVSTDLNIKFSAAVNGENFNCGATYKNVGSATTNEYKINDFRFYIYDIKLQQLDGSFYPLELKQDGKWQYKNIALLDFENGCLNGTVETNPQITATLPVGKTANDFKGICFNLGLPFEENHSDPTTAPAPINMTGMLWSWTTGRKFLRVDGIGDPLGLNTPFVLHLGSTGCSDVNKLGKQPDAPCTYTNAPQICLSEFVPNQQTIIADIGKVLKNSNIAYNTANTASGCMSGNNDPECQMIFPLLGLDFAYISAAGSTPAIFPKQPQTFFSLK
ncbi:MAG: hypothetical protein RIT27_243 [Pseudomonadota bacterium]|jgi:uncharacterized repeat protein (TIGR04052 family)